MTYAKNALVIYDHCPAIVNNVREKEFYILTWLEEGKPTSGGEHRSFDFRLATAKEIKTHKLGFEKLVRMYGKQPA